MTGEGPRPFVQFAVPALLLLALHGVNAGFGGFLEDGRKLIGPDAYMRMVRAEELFYGAPWWDSYSPRSDETLHWSRALDSVILLLTQLFRLFLSDRQALYFAGLFVSPILHLGVLAALLWAVAPILNKAARMVVGIVFAFQLTIATYLAVGRPDHHGLILLFWCLCLGSLFRLLRPASGRWVAVDAGLFASLALWVSIEGLFAVALLYGALGLAWLLSDEDNTDRIAIFGVVLAICAGIAIALEHAPTNWWLVQYDKISIAQLAPLWFAAMGWVLIAFLGRPNGFAAKLFLVSIGISVVFALSYYFYPKLLSGPLADVHPRVVNEWLANNAEVGALINWRNTDTISPVAVTYALQLVVALPVALTMALRSTIENRACWWTVTILIAAVAVLTLQEKRWGTYLQLLTCIPFGFALYSCLGFAGRWSLPLRVPARILTMIAFLFCPMLIGLAFHVKPEQTASSGHCDMRTLAVQLHDFDKPQTILASNFRGPELLYRTQHSVVATPYHRNAAGILAVFDVMRATDMTHARAILVKQGVDLILICPLDGENKTYRGDKGRTFFDRLEKGALPAWLKEWPLNLDEDSKFRLFQVRPST